MYYIFQTFLETFTPSYRLQNEQVGHLQALPGGLRVFYLDRCEYGMRLAHTSLAAAMVTYLIHDHIFI